MDARANRLDDFEHRRLESLRHGVIDFPSHHEQDAPGTGLLRQRLVDLIDSTTPSTITLVTAPAGFGKSTFATQWAMRTAAKVAWVGLRPESNTPDRFLGDLLSALLSVEESVADFKSDLPRIDEVLSVLNRVTETDAVSLVLDDYHLIENHDVIRLTDAIIRELPERASLFLLSRSLPPLSLGRLRLGGQLREITEVELRFDSFEVSKLANAHAGLRLSDAQVQRLTERTEGWIAGIRLALLAMQSAGAGQIDSIIDGLSGHQWLDDYVVEEVIDQLPGDLQEFVLRTASLDALEPELCNAALGSHHSAALIDELHRRLIFVRRDQHIGPLSYHALFAECAGRIAERRIQLEDLLQIHHRAAEWLELHGRIEEAIEQFLRARNAESAARLTAVLCRHLMDRGHNGAMLYWFAKLPQEVILANPALAYWNARALLGTGRFREGREMERLASPGWLASGVPTQLAYAAAIRGLIASFDGDTQEPLRLCYQSLHWFPKECLTERCFVWCEAAVYEFIRGNDEIAHQAYRQAERNQELLPGNHRNWSVFVAAERANWYAMRGDLVATERLLTHHLEHLSVEFRDEAAKFRYRRAAIYLEQNELEKARADIAHVLEDFESFSRKYWWSEALIVIARVQWANGERAESDATIQQVLEHEAENGGVHFGAGARALQASHWIETGQVELARDWGRFRTSISDEWPRDFGDFDMFAPQIQLLVANGDIAGASRMARDRIEEAREIKQWATIIPLYMWEFVAQMELGNERAALQALSSALEIGSLGGFVRSYFPPGIDMLPWFRWAMSRLLVDQASYLQHVITLRYPGIDVQRDESRDGSFVFGDAAGILSRREAQVLGMLSEGLSNRAIAERLFISETTVKKHIRGIFAKLSVANRTSAVVRARKLALIA